MSGTRTHYDTLGLTKGASQDDIKSAYRRIAKLHHPDRSRDPGSPKIFLEAQNAYEALRDPDDRRRYDLRLEDEARRQREREDDERRRRIADQKRREEAASASKKRTTTASRGAINVVTDVARLSAMFSRGQFADSEKLARDIMRVDPKHPIPYAILGDLARARGDYEEASKMYSWALQMDPKNATYLKRYEDLMLRAKVSMTAKGKATVSRPDEKPGAALVALSIIVCMAALYLILSPEKKAFATIAPVSTWTIGLIVMLFLSGVAVGACLAVGNVIDRLDSATGGRVGPTVALGIVAAVSFPASLVLYGLLGLVQKAFVPSTTRVMAGVAGCTFILALAATISTAETAIPQVLLWGGNLCYIGALCGWTVADSVRR